ncbi:DUF4861 domain-containing protein [Bacteroides sp. 519]|uniref:DUF4861 domain-containing protein n=1 Tax=Bacteroides sp. 519 TaxID=2302937 RepID=UPI0013D22675|nr:DUF4861 domain-containing protein [Bacteroides sp. 519]NDV57611.1 DUF4861 domain-containing protein [Bacteroides sp. 519]
MKNLFFLLITCIAFLSCQENAGVTVTVTNPIDLERTNEMIEVSMADVAKSLNLPADGLVVVKDAQGNEIAYQVTHDEKIIFPVSVGANTNATYTIQQGTPKEVSVIACGKQYPERVDDIAWENDRVAFRTYGPALQRTGERAFGYDVWNKRATTEPVVEERYAIELNPETLAQIDSLRKVDPAAAAKLRAETSYHVDHGNGGDCYKVGPTLGGGTAALLADGEIVYPYCYKTFEILDNGPLRFTVKLTYNPLTVKDDTNVIETRVISLDAGSHLNKTVISYTGLSGATPVATGIVLHEPDGEVTADAAKGFITYVDPTDNPKADNGKIFVGAAFPKAVTEAKPVLFGEEEKANRGGADGHVLAISDYIPGSEYTYYWGAGWSKANIKDAAQWDQYMSDYAQKVRNPLVIKY